VAFHHFVDLDVVVDELDEGVRLDVHDGLGLVIEQIDDRDLLVGDAGLGVGAHRVVDHKLQLVLLLLLEALVSVAVLPHQIHHPFI